MPLTNSMSNIISLRPQHILWYSFTKRKGLRGQKSNLGMSIFGPNGHALVKKIDQQINLIFTRVILPINNHLSPLPEPLHLEGTQLISICQLGENSVKLPISHKSLTPKGAPSIFDTGLDDQNYFWPFITMVVRNNHIKIHLMIYPRVRGPSSLSFVWWVIIVSR